MPTGPEPFPVETLRRQFPALQHSREGKVPVFLDGPAGTQVPQRTILAMVRYLSTCNANCGGHFATSQESDHILDLARLWMADFLGAPSPDEIVFGQNMTSLTFHLGRSLGRTWRPGDEVVVTRLDHDANITPWVLAARDAGATVRWVDIRPEDCTVDMEDLQRKINERTKLVAVTAAANTVGSLVDIPAVVRLAQAVGAQVFVDAVHYAPHAPIDVQAWGCDYLACSAYKFFGPHVGILWGRRELLERLEPYKVRPAAEKLPHRWMTGTQNHEGLAGLTGTLDYLADLGKSLLTPDTVPESGSLRRLQLRAAMQAIRACETELARRLLNLLAALPAFRIWGISDKRRLAERVPTVSVTHARLAPAELAQRLAAEQIYAWHGNNYALALTERLGLEERGGFLRLGLVHYNTVEEIDRLGKALEKM